MSVSLDQQQLAVLTRIGKSPDGAMLRLIVKAWLEDADKRCRTLDGPKLHQAQGEAQALDRLGNLLEHAEKRLSDAQSSNRPRRLQDAASWAA